MKTKLILSVWLFASITLLGQKKNKVESAWVLVYANDEHGNKMSGDLGKLVGAVKNGIPVRIGRTIQHPRKV